LTHLQDKKDLIDAKKYYRLVGTNGLCEEEL
jgi:hypothetical protein